MSPKLAIHELEQSPQLSQAAVDAFLAEHEFPIVEGKTVTFVYVGRAREVRLQHWIFGLESSQPFQHLRGTELWFLVIELPERSRVEYKLAIFDGHGRRMIQDPLNPHIAHDPFGANSVVRGAGFDTADWAREDATARPGTFEEHSLQSAAFGDRRDVRVYLPARFRTTRRYPLLIAHDGEDYVRFAALKEVLDNLIDRHEIEPMVVALTHSSNRLHEYGDDERHARFLAEELVPHLEEAYPLLPGPANRGLLGASFGAVASLSASWRHPGVFGKLLLQSGSFVFTDIGDHDRGPAFDAVVDFVNAFREAPGKPSDRVYVTCGTYESMIYYNRSMVPFLQGLGMDVRFTEARDGHNWENWRDRLREGLSWLFPGPLWMVYE
jgi:enterochelin esterase family protein